MKNQRKRQREVEGEIGRRFNFQEQTCFPIYCFMCFPWSPGEDGISLTGDTAEPKDCVGSRRLRVADSLPQTGGPLHNLL